MFLFEADIILYIHLKCVYAHVKYFSCILNIIFALIKTIEWLMLKTKCSNFVPTDIASEVSDFLNFLKANMLYIGAIVYINWSDITYY